MADDPSPVRQISSDEHVKESGVRVLGSYLAAPEHAFFFILEAEDYGSVVRYLRPLMKAGTPDIVPVQTTAEALSLFPPA